MRYNKIIGTGGIGIGMLFHTNQMDTLGRSESRLVTLSQAKDYCKQHIVFYYASACSPDETKVYPIGYVGKDVSGDQLLLEMQREGMDISYVGQSEDSATMLSICLQYPDKEGCNFTAINNAAIKVTPAYIEKCMDAIGVDEHTIVAAIPEVSVESRVAMLKRGSGQGAFCVLSVPVAEAEAFWNAGAFSYCDLLAVNEEEAKAVADCQEEGENLVRILYKKISNENASVKILITCGKKGAYCIDEAGIEWIAPFPGQPINTTGAGDAFLGGTLAGIARGLPLRKAKGDVVFGTTKLASAVELGTICAGMAIECQDSIALGVTPDSIKKRIQEQRWGVEPWFIK